jgi:hypothetical protein
VPAARIRIERPSKRHPMDAIEGGFAVCDDVLGARHPLMLEHVF